MSRDESWFAFWLGSLVFVGASLAAVHAASGSGKSWWLAVTLAVIAAALMSVDWIFGRKP